MWNSVEYYLHSFLLLRNIPFIYCTINILIIRKLFVESTAVLIDIYLHISFVWNIFFPMWKFVKFLVKSNQSRSACAIINFKFQFLSSTEMTQSIEN